MTAMCTRMGRGSPAGQTHVGVVCAREVACSVPPWSVPLSPAPTLSRGRAARSATAVSMATRSSGTARFFLIQRRSARNVPVTMATSAAD